MKFTILAVVSILSSGCSEKGAHRAELISIVNRCILIGVGE